MRVLELYSGIGGMHLALQESEVDGEIIAAVDINTVANAVYKHNFPAITLYNRNIQSLTSKFINNLNVDTILMSPPCQPFTRNGLKQDITDARTNSFVHLLQLLPELHIENLLIENVKGFESSKMHGLLLESLKNAQYIYQEFILTPTQFGVPNTRHRYYCLARKLPKNFSFITGPLMESFPYKLSYDLPPLSSILEEGRDLGKYSIPEKILQKRAEILDICYGDSTRSCCFTKAYGRYVEGTGSVFTNKTKEEVDLVYSELKCLENSEEYINCVKKLNFRFFTPREICRLMAFPDSFKFPCEITDKQKYMLLGNSVNIKVVAELIKLFNMYHIFSLHNLKICTVGMCARGNANFLLKTKF